MKFRRHSKIIEIIKNYDIETQEELTEKLRESGFDVTQATISRDIRELKLIKISTSNGNQKYDVINTNVSQISSKHLKIFSNCILSIDAAQNMIVIKTLSGMAMAVAAAIDSMDNKDIIGTIAGDDTIFCVAKTEEKSYEIINKLKFIYEQQE